MSNGRRLSRGDNRRNARLGRLREVLPRKPAVLGLDLADDKHVSALIDHDSKVLARRTMRCRPWQLAEAIEWGRRQALTAGFAGVTLACEPTGHRWKVVDELAVRAGIELVCAQPLLVHRAREAEDFTRDKSDDKDALLIARLATPECADCRAQPSASAGPAAHGHPRPALCVSAGSSGAGSPRPPPPVRSAACSCWRAQRSSCRQPASVVRNVRSRPIYRPSSSTATAQWVSVWTSTPTLTTIRRPLLAA